MPGREPAEAVSLLAEAGDRERRHATERKPSRQARARTASNAGRRRAAREKTQAASSAQPMAFFRPKRSPA